MIGVAMPTKSLQRWNQDGDNMKKLLEQAGYSVDLQYAADSVETQVSQLENMITKGQKFWLLLQLMGITNRCSGRSSKREYQSYCL